MRFLESSRGRVFDQISDRDTQDASYFRKCGDGGHILRFIKNTLDRSIRNIRLSGKLSHTDVFFFRYLLYT